LLGIKIDSSDDSENASDSIRVKCEFDSIVIDENDLQDEKQFDPRISTFLGIKIDSSDEHENAANAIRVKHEFDSIEIDDKVTSINAETLMNFNIPWNQN
jgi:hypothetical protein